MAVRIGRWAPGKPKNRPGCEKIRPDAENGHREASEREILALKSPGWRASALSCLSMAAGSKASHTRFLRSPGVRYSAGWRTRRRQRRARTGGKHRSSELGRRNGL